jgi:uncharacterized integral membrane protein
MLGAEAPGGAVHELERNDRPPQPQTGTDDTPDSVESAGSPTGRGRVSRWGEAEADLSILDDESSLRLEAERESLRDAREARSQRRTRARLSNWRQGILLAVLVLAMLTSATVSLVGALPGGGQEATRAGLIALCAICGGALARLQAEERQQGRERRVRTRGRTLDADDLPD